MMRESQGMNIARLLGRLRSHLLLAIMAGCLVSAPSLFAGGDDQVIVAATKKYLAGESYTGEIKVTVEKVEGDYARVLQPQKTTRPTRRWSF